MYTKNYKLWKQHAYCKQSLNGAKNAVGANVTITHSSNAQYNHHDIPCLLETYNNQTTELSSSSAPGVYFGSGVIAPTENDYTITQIRTGISVSTSTVKTNSSADGLTFSKAYTITNTGSEDMSVSEVGIFGNAFISSYDQNLFLFKRDVFTPVVIKPGESHVFTIGFDMPWPTD